MFMKIILFVGPLGHVGGLSRYTKDLLDFKTENKIILFNTIRPRNKQLKSDKTGYVATLLAGGFSHFVKAASVTLWHFMCFPVILLLRRPDIVHIAGTGYYVFWENAYYQLMSKLFGKKVFLHYLGAFDLFYEHSSRFVRIIIRIVLKSSDKIGVLSLKVKQLIGTFIPENKMFLLPSSVNVKEFIQKRSNSVHSESDILQILFMGGWDPYRKGIKVLLKSIPIVVQECKNVSFIFTGCDVLKGLKEECEYLGITNFVQLHGWVTQEEKILLYNSVDVFVLPSNNEGLPYGIIEAMAAGLPVVSTYVGGIPEVVENGINGFLINPGDHQDLAEKMIRLIKDSALRSMMGVTNVTKIQQSYSLESVQTKLSTIYNEM
jgi:glycosyltransferase involved in cell wall biosynthesis